MLLDVINFIWSRELSFWISARYIYLCIFGIFNLAKVSRKEWWYFWTQHFAIVIINLSDSKEDAQKSSLSWSDLNLNWFFPHVFCSSFFLEKCEVIFEKNAAGIYICNESPFVAWVTKTLTRAQSWDFVNKKFICFPFPSFNKRDGIFSIDQLCHAIQAYRMQVHLFCHKKELVKSRVNRSIYVVSMTSQ